MLGKTSKKYSPKWWFDDDLPWDPNPSKNITQKKQTQEGFFRWCKMVSFIPWDPNPKKMTKIQQIPKIPKFNPTFLGQTAATTAAGRTKPLPFLGHFCRMGRDSLLLLSEGNFLWVSAGLLRIPYSYWPEK